MKQPFNTLTKSDVETLRRKPIAVAAGKSVAYYFTKTDVDNAALHLETLYKGTIRKSFAAKVLLLNLIY